MSSWRTLPRATSATLARAFAAEVQRQGQTAIVADLCGMAFDPVLKNVERADRDDRHHAWIGAALDRVAASGVLVRV